MGIEAIDRIENSLDSGRPVNLIVRTKRYDSPIMRSVFSEGLETPFRGIYEDLLDDYALERSIEFGKYHTVYRVLPVEFLSGDSQ